MKRLAVTLLLLIATNSCADDQVVLERGPLGPATYEVEVRAEGNERVRLREHRQAVLRISSEPGGAAFALRTDGGDIIRAELRRLADGSIDLEDVRGAVFDRARQAELASLVGQLDPPLPQRPVRLGERWSSTQRIRTETLQAVFRTELGIARYRRVAATDAAELEGMVSGRLETTRLAGRLSGTLEGQTRITWSVETGRMVAANTELVWTLQDGDRVTLETSVRSR